MLINIYDYHESNQSHHYNNVVWTVHKSIPSWIHIIPNVFGHSSSRHWHSISFSKPTFDDEYTSLNSHGQVQQISDCQSFHVGKHWFWPFRKAVSSWRRLQFFGCQNYQIDDVANYTNDDNYWSYHLQS